MVSEDDIAKSDTYGTQATKLFVDFRENVIQWVAGQEESEHNVSQNETDLPQLTDNKVDGDPSMSSVEELEQSLLRDEKEIAQIERKEQLIRRSLELKQQKLERDLQSRRR